jgi:transcriptional regulator with XRE-family HTH domain
VGRRLADGVAEMNLRALRESLGKTQEEIARLADITQSQLSKIERRDDHLISTLRRYVRALGGNIEVIAQVGERRVSLRGV